MPPGSDDQRPGATCPLCGAPLDPSPFGGSVEPLADHFGRTCRAIPFFLG